MHNDDIERADERAEDRRAGVDAADDTGLVRQQEILIQAELGEQGEDEVEGEAR